MLLRSVEEDLEPYPTTLDQPSRPENSKEADSVAVLNHTHLSRLLRNQKEEYKPDGEPHITPAAPTSSSPNRKRSSINNSFKRSNYGSCKHPKAVLKLIHFQPRGLRCRPLRQLWRDAFPASCVTHTACSASRILSPNQPRAYQPLSLHAQGWLGPG